jgi:DNA polymerase-3 subunit alpha
MALGFANLHTHSHFTLLDGVAQIPDLVKHAKKLGYRALGLTDSGNLYGAIEFWNECRKKEIKPILGVDFYVAARTRRDREPRIDSRRSRLVLLAENEAGWKNLIALVTYSHLEGMYYKPRVDRELLARHREGLVCVLPFWSGDVARALAVANRERALEFLNFYRQTYGAENVFLEICTHPEIESAAVRRQQLVAFAREHGVPMVAAHDTYYLKPEDRVARTTLQSVMSSGAPGEAKSDEDDDFSLPTPEEMAERFADLPEALENAERIAERCALEFEMGKWKFPDYQIESGRAPDDELRHLAYEGAARRGVALEGATKERLDYELSVIAKKGYSVYFLVVADLLREARSRGILTTIRGSVAGSLTTFVTGITNVNPLEYGLPFERFLNPDRPSAPDIDMDYADNRRDEMIAYVREKYGADKVAQIGTFGTMMAKGSVRDTARALGYDYQRGDQISKLIPMGAQGFPMTIDKALAEVPELAELYKKDADARRIIDTAKKIEGCARHMSVHAAGVVIAPRPLVEYTPVQYDPKVGSSGDASGKLVTQFDMHAVGEDNVGLLKFDFLGIRNLSILADAVRRVREATGEVVDIENIPLDDAKTFRMLARGETEGLFQLNGDGMTKFLVELKPSTIHDINAMVALYRPGPIEMIPEYIARKHDPSKVRYLDPRMKPILERSYGVITYQDDVMLIAIELAGYSWIEADKLRKAMGKKIPELMEEQKSKLKKGLLEHGMSEAKADELWLLIEPFAAYGFNKAHAASYGRVAYQTAYMKANYPALYMAAVLVAHTSDTEEIAAYVRECNRMGIPVLPPSVNESGADFTVLRDAEGKESIRFGLATIKNFGEGVARAIEEERRRGGPFATLEDFMTRVNGKDFNKKGLEALAKCGALDELGDRATIVANLDRLVEWKRDLSKVPENQGSLFGGGAAPVSLRLEPAAPATLEERLGWEKELLGLYLSGHPLDPWRESLAGREKNAAWVKDRSRDGNPIVIAGVVEAVKDLRTSKGDLMSFMTLRDLSGAVECVVFPEARKTYDELVRADRVVAVKGKVSLRNGERSIIVDKMKRLAAGATT